MKSKSEHSFPESLPKCILLVLFNLLGFPHYLILGRYLQLESLFCKILGTEIKKLVHESLKQFAGCSLEAVLKFLAERILKGKVAQFANKTLDGMFFCMFMIHFIVVLFWFFFCFFIFWFQRTSRKRI